MPLITCPHCGLQRQIDAARLAPRQLAARCSRCRTTFTVDGAALLAPAEDSLELDWGDRESGRPAAQPEPEPSHPLATPLSAISSAPGSGQSAASEGAAPAWQDSGAAPAPEALAGGSNRFGYGDRRVDALALPLAFAAAYLSKLLVLPGFLLEWFRAWLHEFGHAFAAWLSSRAATPLALFPGFAWASTRPDKSAVVFVCFLFLIGVVGYRAAKARSGFLFGLAIALFLLQVIFTFLLPARLSEIAMIFAGCGGELILGTLLVVGFYYRLPDRMRWDFFRYPLLLAGAYAFGAAFSTWIRALHDTRAIPWGTGFGGRDDEGGDMNRLVDFGWSTSYLTRSYFALALVCAAVMAAHYFWFLARSKPSRTGDVSTPESV